MVVGEGEWYRERRGNKVRGEEGGWKKQKNGSMLGPASVYSAHFALCCFRLFERCAVSLVMIATILGKSFPVI